MCNQCFKASTLYAGETELGIYDDYINDSNNKHLFALKDNSKPIRPRELQPNSMSWTMSQDFMEYPALDANGKSFWSYSTAS